MGVKLSVHGGRRRAHTYHNMCGGQMASWNSFYPVGPRDLTQGARPGCKYPYPLSHLAQLKLEFFKKISQM